MGAHRPYSVAVHVDGGNRGVMDELRASLGGAQREGGRDGAHSGGAVVWVQDPADTASGVDKLWGTGRRLRRAQHSGGQPPLLGKLGAASQVGHRLGCGRDFQTPTPIEAGHSLVLEFLIEGGAGPGQLGGHRRFAEQAEEARSMPGRAG